MARILAHSITRTSVPALDKILGYPYKVLDHGFVRVIDYMGDDASIVEAARMSYTDGTKTISDDETLLRYLMRQYHTGPFEMCEIKFHFKMPMFIGEQTLRHRTANVNKESGRYSILTEDKYVPAPERMAKQSTTNKQGSGIAFDFAQACALVGEIRFVHEHVQEIYQRFVSDDVDMARELARGILPANQYAEFFWKIDLSNLLKFLHLRLDHHAQWEIQVYAQQIRDIVGLWVPKSLRAFEDYRQNAITFSAPELEILREMLAQNEFQIVDVEMPNRMSKREGGEFMDKLKRLLNGPR